MALCCTANLCSSPNHNHQQASIDMTKVTCHTLQCPRYTSVVQEAIWDIHGMQCSLMLPIQVLVAITAPVHKWQRHKLSIAATHPFVWMPCYDYLIQTTTTPLSVTCGHCNICGPGTMNCLFSCSDCLHQVGCAVCMQVHNNMQWMWM